MKWPNTLVLGQLRSDTDLEMFTPGFLGSNPRLVIFSHFSSIFWPLFYFSFASLCYHKKSIRGSIFWTDIRAWMMGQGIELYACSCSSVGMRVNKKV